jgi:hypothetical protein
MSDWCGAAPTAAPFDDLTGADYAARSTTMGAAIAVPIDVSR